MCSVKSQLDAFGETDVVVGQEKSELQSIIASCDELLTKTEANIFRWGVQTLLGDSRIGSVDLGAVLRKSLRSIVDAFPDPYSELEEEVLVEISSFRTSFTYGIKGMFEPRACSNLARLSESFIFIHLKTSETIFVLK